MEMVNNSYTKYKTFNAKASGTNYDRCVYEVLNTKKQASLFLSIIIHTMLFFAIFYYLQRCYWAARYFQIRKGVDW